MGGAYAEALKAFRAADKHCYPTRPDNPVVACVHNPAKWSEQEPSPRFANANAAFIAGEHNGVVVVDIDTEDHHVRDMAQERFGESPFEVETPSGGLHRYYRFNGERRTIRPFGPATPIDILGQATGRGGAVVAPPSRREASSGKRAGRYVLRGDWEALQDLPKIHDGAIPESVTHGDARRALRTGEGRNNLLFEYARNIAASAHGEDELASELLAENARLADPLDATEVGKIARNVWQYRLNGTLFRRGTPSIVGWSADDALIFAANPDAFLFETVLRAIHAARHIRGEPFAISPHAMARDGVIPGWSHVRYRNARRWMIEAGRIEYVHHGGRGKGDPDLYRFTSKGKASLPNVTNPLPEYSDG